VSEEEEEKKSENRRGNGWILCKRYFDQGLSGLGGFGWCAPITNDGWGMKGVEGRNGENVQLI
jgi:hypothetical protein